MQLVSAHPVISYHFESVSKKYVLQIESVFVELPVTSTPTTVATEDPLRSWQFYAAAIPSGILLALLITIAIICCKMCCKKKVGFVRGNKHNPTSASVTLLSLTPL